MKQKKTPKEQRKERLVEVANTLRSMFSRIMLTDGADDKIIDDLITEAITVELKLRQAATIEVPQEDGPKSWAPPGQTGDQSMKNGYEKASRWDEHLNRLLVKCPIDGENAREYLKFARQLKTSFEIIEQQAIGMLTATPLTVTGTQTFGQADVTDLIKAALSVMADESQAEAFEKAISENDDLDPDLLLLAKETIHG